jgi:hypothetical protein
VAVAARWLGSGGGVSWAARRGGRSWPAGRRIGFGGAAAAGRTCMLLVTEVDFLKALARKFSQL